MKGGNIFLLLLVILMVVAIGVVYLMGLRQDAALASQLDLMRTQIDQMSKANSTFLAKQLDFEDRMQVLSKDVISQSDSVKNMQADFKAIDQERKDLAEKLSRLIVDVESLQKSFQMTLSKEQAVPSVPDVLTKPAGDVPNVESAVFAPPILPADTAVVGENVKQVLVEENMSVESNGS